MEPCGDRRQTRRRLRSVGPRSAALRRLAPARRWSGDLDRSAGVYALAGRAEAGLCLPPRPALLVDRPPLPGVRCPADPGELPVGKGAAVLRPALGPGAAPRRLPRN